jgi:hypothetical protein
MKPSLTRVRNRCTAALIGLLVIAVGANAMAWSYVIPLLGADDPASAKAITGRCAEDGSQLKCEFVDLEIRTIAGDKLTCEISVSLPYAVTLSNDNRNQWSARDGPDPADACLAIRTFTLQRERESVWRITRTRLITNPAGDGTEFMRQVCETAESTTESFSSRIRDKYRSCERLNFGR